MCVYCKPASVVLDKLWEDESFRDYFYDRGLDLADLGPMVHDVFVPAYLHIKSGLEGGALEMLEAQVTEDLLSPLYDRPNFREMWESWGVEMRQSFLQEQSEMQLGSLLVMVYADQLAEEYKKAYQRHHGQ